MPPKPQTKTTTAVKKPASKGGTAAKTTAKKPEQNKKVVQKEATKTTPAKPAEKSPEATSAPAKPEVTKPPEYRIKVKEIADVILNDKEGKLYKPNDQGNLWWPYVIDPSEISGRFLRYRECTFINGLDAEFMNDKERVRIALLGSLRHGKKFVIDMMGADLYDPIENIMEKIQPGLLKMVMDRSILEDKNIEKLISKSDDSIYQNVLDYGLKTEFGFVVVTKDDNPTGFTGKMSTVIVEQ